MIKAIRFFRITLVLVWAVVPYVIIANATNKSAENPAGQSEPYSSVIARIENARLAFDKHGYNEYTDSLCQEVLRAAEMTHDNRIILEAYNAFFECANLRSCDEKAMKYANKALEICNTFEPDELHWRTLYNLSGYFRVRYEHERALNLAYKSFTMAEALQSYVYKVKSQLAIGQCMESQNQKIDAFRNYLGAMNLAQQHRDAQMLRLCYKTLSFYFNINRMHAKAIEYKRKEIEMLVVSDPIDSLTLNWILYELEEISFHSRNDLNTFAILAILDYAHRHQIQPLRRSAMDLYRAHFIRNLDLDGLKQLYLSDFPEALENLRNEDLPMYLRVKAYLFEREGLGDSAIAYFSEAAILMEDHPNKILTANFYIRFAELLQRMDQAEACREKLRRAIALAEGGSYLPFMLDATNMLEQSYASDGAFEEALQYARKARQLSDSLAALTRSEDLFILEIDNATRQAELENIRAEEEWKRKLSIQYTAITIILVAIFFMVFTLGRLAIREWMKRLMSFLSFVMLFEFIILILDYQIHQITHGEPWKVLLIKIALISILLPLHHLLERRMRDYLVARRLRIKWMKAAKKQVPTLE